MTSSELFRLGLCEGRAAGFVMRTSRNRLGRRPARATGPAVSVVLREALLWSRRRAAGEGL